MCLVESVLHLIDFALFCALNCSIQEWSLMNMRTKENSCHNPVALNFLRAHVAHTHIYAHTVSLALAHTHTHTHTLTHSLTHSHTHSPGLRVRTDTRPRRSPGRTRSAGSRSGPARRTAPCTPGRGTRRPAPSTSPSDPATQARAGATGTESTWNTTVSAHLGRGRSVNLHGLHCCEPHAVKLDRVGPEQGTGAFLSANPTPKVSELTAS